MFSMKVLCALTTVAACLLGGHPASAAPVAAASQSEYLQTAAASTRHISFTRWQGRDLSKGTMSGATRAPSGVVISRPTARVTYRDPYGSSGRLTYDRGVWVSPWTTPGFSVGQLVASWQASTPSGTFIQIAVRGRTGSGSVGSWDSLGLWAGHDIGFHRRSLGAQKDDIASVNIDTWQVHSRVRVPRWQLKASLYRLVGSGKTPYLKRIGTVASRLPHTFVASTPGVARGIDLQVPRYSQEIHKGEYPRYDGGGEAWCSPTSTSMLLAYWNAGPTPREYAWVSDSYAQPWVDHAARYTYAWGYDGTGDWPFNTAYAGTFGVDSFVTRLRSLREAEVFIKAGLPLAASIAFGPGELDGSPLTSTGGHLLVIRGFTSTGNVIVNDPAAATAAGVRRVYDRRQFEAAWLPKTGGTVYVVRGLDTPLPNPYQHSNW